MKQLKNFRLLVMGAALFLILPSCKKIVGEGPLITEPRNVSTFTGIAVSIDADVYFSQVADQSITIDAQRNVLDEIETVAIDNTLRIRYKHPNANVRSERVVIHITNPELRYVEQDGSGKIDIEGVIDPTVAKIVVSGSGNIHAQQVYSSSIETIISGSGRVNVEDGEANSEKVTISGSGQADLSQVQVKDVESNISGSGSMKVFATQNLKAKISGSGTVFYRGNPNITTQISGSGSVVKM
jgi:hypothetical protein